MNDISSDHSMILNVSEAVSSWSLLRAPVDKVSMRDALDLQRAQYDQPQG
jgi:hypothetical protein